MTTTRQVHVRPANDHIRIWPCVDRCPSNGRLRLTARASDSMVICAAKRQAAKCGS
jgi:hypothetical protein